MRRGHGEAAATILLHKDWTMLKRFLFCEYVGRDPRAGTEVPRFRIEVTKTDGDIERWLLSLVAPCCACGRQMFPIRERANGGGLYFAATCEDKLSGSCSKGAAAREEYLRVREALLDFGAPGLHQPTTERLPF
jgi:hypothetical protein